MWRKHKSNSMVYKFPHFLRGGGSKILKLDRVMTNFFESSHSVTQFVASILLPSSAPAQCQCCIKTIQTSQKIKTFNQVSPAVAELDLAQSQRA